MSRTIAESVSLLSETLGNCKTNLKEKEVADVDNIKISDVDEKIAEIQGGGGSGSGLNLIKDVTLNSKPVTSSEFSWGFSMGSFEFDDTLKFTVKEDDVYLILSKTSSLNVTIDPQPQTGDLPILTNYQLEKEQTYTLKINGDASTGGHYDIYFNKANKSGTYRSDTIADIFSLYVG